MIYLKKTANAWNSAAFEHVIKDELQSLNIDQLPLQDALRNSAYAVDDERQVLIHNAHEKEGAIHVRAGIFFSGIDAGCSCADDPTPEETRTEYCDVGITINMDGAAQIALLDD